MSAIEALRARQSEIRSIAAKHGAGNVRVFGSVARGEAGVNSDVDILIDIVGPTTPWFPGGLLADLEKALGRHVDIVIARSLHPLIRESVLKEAIPL
jgi:predicted nucleotidyltransferase